jgi:hypothetical protein
MTLRIPTTPGNSRSPSWNGNCERLAVRELAREDLASAADHA